MATASMKAMKTGAPVAGTPLGAGPVESSLETKRKGAKSLQAKPGGKPGENGTDGTQLVTFLLKDEEFGFDIMSVQEIIRLPKMARLPQTPPYVEGVANLRGTLLPIVDIRARFGMKREERTDRSRVLVIDIAGRRTGLLVDSVRQVTRVGRNEFEPPPAAICSETANYIDGVVKLDNGERIIIALDAARVCVFASPESADKSASDGSGEKPPKPAAKAEAGETRDAETVIGAKSGGGKVHQLVSFQVGREEFAFPMEHVREILRVQAPKEVPGAPEHLLGVLTVRGQILPIVDLRRLLRQNSFAADHIAECRQGGAEYEKWLAKTGTPPEDFAGALAASERLRRWLTGFSSSSQLLTETAAQARASNEQVAKLAAGLSAHEIDAKGLDAAHRDLLASARSVATALSAFAERVEGNIAEDQRIIVVDSDGFLLGLVVDHVNEVLAVQDEAIEEPPRIADHECLSLSGIAKLDDGNRLILLLSTGNLLDRKKLAEIAEGGEAEEMAEETSHGVAKEADGEQDRGELQLVTFQLGKEEYGIPIARIQEIDRLSKITQTPKAPKFVEGVTNLRGEVIPVLSTRMLFELEEKVSDDRTRVIIVDLGGAKTGLIVDSVKEVLSIPARNIAPPPASISGGADGQFISGIGKVENGKRMIVLLDVGRVLTSGERSEVVALGSPA